MLHAVVFFWLDSPFDSSYILGFHLSVGMSKGVEQYANLGLIREMMIFIILH